MLNRSDKITILSLSWRDIASPTAGGAEVHTHEMFKRANKGKFRIYHISVKNDGRERHEVIDGVHYLRMGNIVTVIPKAMKYYRQNKENIDFVIDQCNTHRFFTPFWVEKQKRIFYIHQLTKEIWDYSVGFPFNILGRSLEEWWLRLNKRDAVITVSESTRQELVDRGYRASNIHIIHNGVSFIPWESGKWYPKEKAPTFVYVGRYAPYKGIDISLKAFGECKKIFPDARLWIMGKKDEQYVAGKLLPLCRGYRLRWLDVTGQGEEEADILCWGFVSEAKKLELLSRAHVLLFPSIREGWGIPITEAGCVGTPCIAFNSAGIREAVDYGRAGYLCGENTEKDLAEQMILAVTDAALYKEKQSRAHAFSSQFLWDKAGSGFEQFVELHYKGRNV